MRAIKTSPPAHPEEAKKGGLQGPVVLDCTIGTDGRVTDAVVVQGDSPLSEAAIKAAKNWRYEPLLFQGKPKAVIVPIRVNFVLEETLRFDDLLDSLSSKYEAVRESAAQVLGNMLRGPRPSPGRETRWARERLTALLKQEQSSRVRNAAEKALAQMEIQE